MSKVGANAVGDVEIEYIFDWRAIETDFVPAAAPVGVQLIGQLNVSIEAA